MKIVSTEYLSERATIQCIKIQNNNKTRLNIKAYQTEQFEECGKKKAGINKAQNIVQSFKS